MITEPKESSPIYSQLMPAGAQPNSIAPGRTPTFVDEAEDLALSLLPYLVGLLVAALAVGALFMIAIAQPSWLAPFWASIAGADQKAYWYVTRSSGFVAYGLLWLSMALGLMITNKLARAWPGGPTLNDLHEYASVLGLGFGVLHALALLGDQYTKYTLAQVLAPFASANYRPFWVGLGQVGFYLLLLVTLSFYLRRWIGYRLWRAIHYLSFGVFLLALGHGLLSGTDAGATWAGNLYWGSAVSLAGLTVYRFAIPRRSPAAARR
jgi:predicted ferric reductase